MLKKLSFVILFCGVLAGLFAFTADTATNTITYSQGAEVPLSVNKDVVRTPEAIVLKNGTVDNLAVFYRVGREKESGFSVATTQGTTGLLTWYANAGKNAFAFSDDKKFSTKSISPTPIIYNDKIYLFGTRERNFGIIYNTFSSISDLLSLNFGFSEKQDSGVNNMADLNLSVGHFTGKSKESDDILMTFHDKFCYGGAVKYCYGTVGYREFTHNTDNTLKCEQGVNAVFNQKDNGYYENNNHLAKVTIKNQATQQDENFYYLFARNYLSSKLDVILYNREANCSYTENCPGSTSVSTHTDCPDKAWTILYGLFEDAIARDPVSSIQLGNTLYLYFKGKDGFLKESHVDLSKIADSTQWSAPIAVTFNNGTSEQKIPVASNTGTKVIVFNGWVYIFYVDNVGNRLKYVMYKPVSAQ